MQRTQRQVIALSVLLLTGLVLLAGCGPMPPRAASGNRDNTPPVYRLNGLTMVASPIPASAWGAIPMIQSLDDVRNASRIAARFAKAAREAYKSGNLDLAVANWYWYRRFAVQALNVMQASNQTLYSIRADGTAMIPGKSLVVLPAFDRYGNPRSSSSLTDTADRGTPQVSATVPSRSRQVAGNGDTWTDVPRKTVETGQESRSAGTPGRSLAELEDRVRASDFPMGEAVRLSNGVFVVRHQGSLVMYNPSDEPSLAPLKQLNYLPPIAAPSKVRQNAAPLIAVMNRAGNELFFKNYRPENGSTLGSFIPPNIYTLSGGTNRKAYFDDLGRMTSNPDSARTGEVAYRNNPSYKLAIDSLAAWPNQKNIAEFKNACVFHGLGWLITVSGLQSELLRVSCLNRTTPEQSRDFYILDDKVVQTFESLMADERLIKEMNRAVASSEAWSDALSMVPVLGEVESAAKCLGLPESVVSLAYKKLKGIDKDRAEIAGWKPAPRELGVDTAVNCLEALPLAGKLGKAARKGQLKTNTAKHEELFRLFESFDPIEMARYGKAPSRQTAEAIKRAEKIFPDNTEVIAFAKALYDQAQLFSDMDQTVGGVSRLIKGI